DDLLDATKLAEAVRVGSIKTRVYKAPKSLMGLKSAARAYGMVSRDMMRTKNRIKSVYRSRGIPTEDDVYDAETRKASLKKLPVAHRRLAEFFGQQLDALLPLRKQAETWMKEESKAHPIVRMLATAPGIGRVRSAQVVAIVGTPDRFRARQQFW